MGAPAGWPEAPGRLWGPSLPRGWRRHPQRLYSLESQAGPSTASKASEADSDEAHCESRSRGQGSAGTLKRPPGGRGLLEPRPHPVVPRPRAPGEFRDRLWSAGGIWQEGGRLGPLCLQFEDPETKGRNPASSCCFPPTRPLPTSRDHSRRPYHSPPRGDPTVSSSN